MAAFTNYGDMIYEEISLEGRPGVTIKKLWLCIEARVGCPTPEPLREKLWNITKNLRYVEFFVKPSGLINDKNLMNVTEKVKKLTLSDCWKTYGLNLVAVASDLSQWKALAPNHPITHKSFIMPLQYDLLEKIGRSRNAGESSIAWEKSKSMNLDDSKDEDNTKSAKGAFYLRKKLIQQGLIWQENSVITNKNVILLKLGRFRKSVTRLNVEEEKRLNQLKEMIANQGGQVLLTEVTNIFGITPKQLRILLSSKFPFANLFAVVPMMLKGRKRNVIRNKPSMDENEGAHKPSPENYDWESTLTLHKSEPLAQPIDDEEDGPWNRDVADSRRHRQPLLRQTYLTVASFGPEGATLIEISKSLGFGWRMSRSAIRLLQKAGALKAYVVDYGKLRYARFYAKCFYKESKAIYALDAQRDRLLQNLLAIESSKPSQETLSEESSEKLILEVDGGMVTYQLVGKPPPDKELSHIIKQARIKGKLGCTLRYNMRMNILMEVLQKYNLISEVSQLKKLCIKYQDEIKDIVSAFEGMDRKVVHKLIDQMQSIDLLKLYNIEIVLRGRIRPRLLICKPHLTLTPELLIKALESDLLTFAISIKEKQQLDSGTNKECLPKMERIRVIHEFMFQLAWGNTPGEENEETIMSLNDLNKEETIKEVLLGKNNSLEDNHVTPSTTRRLQPPPSWPQGWINITEMFGALPQNIFSKISTSYESITHAVRYNIFFASNLGLLYMDHAKEHAYLNRYATIIEKTDRLRREHKFHFSSVRSVRTYWDFLRMMCLRHIEPKKPRTKKSRLKTKRIFHLVAPLIGPTEAPAFDNGKIPGDGCGFGGFDSTVFITKKISWHRNVTATHRVCPKRKRPCLPRDLPVNPKKAKRRKVKSKNSNINIKMIVEKEKKNKRNLSLPRRKLSWKPEELHVVLLARVAGAMMLSGKSPTVRTSSHMRSIEINVCDQIFKAAGVKSIIRPFIARRLKLLCGNRHMQRIIGVKLTEACEITSLQKYFGIYLQLRSTTAKLSDTKSKFHTTTLELMLALHRAHFLKNNTSIKTYPNIQTLHKIFSISTHKKKPSDYFKKLTTTDEIEAATIQNAAIAVLGSSDERNWANLLSSVEEEKLRSAVKFLQNHSMIALRNKFYRLSQYYMLTVAPLNEVTISLQTDLEAVSSGRTQIIPTGKEDMPYFDKENTVSCFTLTSNNEIGVDTPSIVALKPLMSLLEKMVSEFLEIGCSSEDIKIYLHKSNNIAKFCCPSLHLKVSQMCQKCWDNVERSLTQLTDNKSIFKVGNDTTRWVSKGFESKWSVNGVDPHPWTKADGTNADSSFFRWMGTMLWCILDRPGISCMDLCTQLRLLRPTHMLSLITKLKDIGSVYTQTIDYEECGLISCEDSNVVLRPTMVIDTLESVLVIPTVNAVSLYEEYKKTISSMDAFNSKVEIA